MDGLGPALTKGIGNFMTKDKAIYIINRLLRDEFPLMTQTKTLRAAKRVIALLQEYDIIKEIIEEAPNVSKEGS